MDPKSKLLISAGFILAVSNTAPATASPQTDDEFFNQLRAAQAVIRSTQSETSETGDALEWRTGWRNWGDWNNGGWKNWDDFKNS